MYTGSLIWCALPRRGRWHAAPYPRFAQHVPARSASSEPRRDAYLSLGAARARWPIRPSKPAGRGSPTLGRFDSFAAPLSFCDPRSPPCWRRGWEGMWTAHGRGRLAAMNASRPLLVGAAFGAGAILGRASASPQFRFARMTGSSIAAPDAAGWITDFLNAAYYRRDPALRHVDDLRLASAIVTTRWHRLGHRRLRLGDVVPFHAAFGRERFVDRARSERGTLGREQLLEGAGAMLGSWFADAYADADRRGGASRSRALRSARPMTPRRAFGSPGSAPRHRRRRPCASRHGTRIRPWRCRRATA
jgi:hypothetical protein